MWPPGSAGLRIAAGAGSPGPSVGRARPAAPTATVAVAAPTATLPAEALPARPIFSADPPVARSTSGPGSRIAIARRVLRSVVRNSRHSGHRARWRWVCAEARRRASWDSMRFVRTASAGGGALVDDLHQRDARPVHDDPRGARRDVQLGSQLPVGEPVELTTHQRVAVAGRQRAEVLEQLAQVGAALVGRRRLVARCGREVIAIDRVQVDAIGPHPAELVETAVAHQPVEPGPQVHRAVVAAQRAVRAPQRLLHHVLGGGRRRAGSGWRSAAALRGSGRGSARTPPRRRRETRR